MTEKASPKGYDPERARARRDEPGVGPDLARPDLARFIQDWSDLWREAVQAQAADPDGLPFGMLTGMVKGGITAEMTAAMEMWRAAMVAWANLSGASSSGAGMSGADTSRSGMPGAGASRADETTSARPLAAASGDLAHTPRTEAASVASDARDAEIERLARRVDELEARLAKLDAPRPAKSRMEKSRGNRG